MVTQPDLLNSPSSSVMLTRAVVTTGISRLDKNRTIQILVERLNEWKGSQSFSLAWNDSTTYDAVMRCNLAPWR